MNTTVAPTVPARALGTVPLWAGARVRAAFITLLSVAGAVGLFEHILRQYLLGSWNDGLRSIAPLLFALAVHALWRELTRGQTLADGRAALAGAVVIGFAVLSSALPSLPVATPVWVYFNGVALFWCGWQGWRRLATPLLLVLALNPVPTFVPQVLDFRLQLIAIHAAAGFAALLHIHHRLYTVSMAFDHGVGMFIAPACDGLRGAVTMTYFSLILAYALKLRLRQAPVLLFSAVGLAYLANFGRLFGLVLFDWLSTKIIPLGAYEPWADAIWGGFLFLIAAALTLVLARRLRRAAAGPAATAGEAA